jgi:hypothetical protein
MVKKMNTYEEDEINFRDILNSLTQSKFLILFTVIAFAIGSIAYSLSLTNKFTSSSTLKLVNESGTTNQSSSGLGMISSIAGINLSGSGSSKSDFVITSITSRDFLRHLLTFEGVKPTLAAYKSYDKVNKKIIYNEIIYNNEKKLFTDDLLKLPTFQNIYSSYKGILSVSIAKSGFITIAVNHESPEFAYSFLSLIINELNTLSRKKDLIESEDSLEYLYSELAKTKQIEIKDSINQLILSELRRQMFAEVRTNYLINPLDQPFLPELKSSPNRAKICITGTILGFFIGILIAIVRYFGFRDNF